MSLKYFVGYLKGSGQMLQCPPPPPQTHCSCPKRLPASNELKAIKNRLIKWDISDWTPPRWLLHAYCMPGAFTVSACLVPRADGLVSLSVVQLASGESSHCVTYLWVSCMQGMERFPDSCSLGEPLRLRELVPIKACTVACWYRGRNIYVQRSPAWSMQTV